MPSSDQPDADPSLPPNRTHRVEPKSRAHVAPDDEGSEQDERSEVGQGQSAVLSGGRYKFVMLALFVFMTLVLLIPTLNPGPIGGHVFFAALVLVVVVFDVRWWRARVSVAPSGLQLRTLFRAHDLRWEQVSGAEVAGSNANNVASLVVVHTVDGRSIKVDGVGNWGKPEAAVDVQRVVGLINAYSRGQRRPH